MSAFRTLVLFLFILPSLTYGEALKQTDVHFGLPFNCEKEKDGKVLCLADKYKPGKTVVLIGATNMCVARTAGTFEIDDYGKPLDVTVLDGADKCKSGIGIAVVGVEPEDVLLLLPRNDKSLVSKSMEKKARQILEADPQNEPWPMADCSPTVLAVGWLKFLFFRCRDVDGPLFYLSNGSVVRLNGWCTSGHVFFSVKRKLYFSYYNACCGCGWHEQLVYDLNGKTPIKIYSNEAFSN